MCTSGRAKGATSSNITFHRWVWGEGVKISANPLNKGSETSHGLTMIDFDVVSSSSNNFGRGDYQQEQHTLIISLCMVIVVKQIWVKNRGKFGMALVHVRLFCSVGENMQFECLWQCTATKPVLFATKERPWLYIYIKHCCFTNHYFHDLHSSIHLLVL